MIEQENIPYTKGEIEAVITSCFVDSRLDGAIGDLITSFGYLAQQESECIGMITEKLWNIVDKLQRERNGGSL